MRTVLYVLAMMLALQVAQAQNVDITVVHNAPDPAISVVDVYITQGGITNKIEDLAYRAASNVSNVVTLFADLEVTMQFAPGTSTDAGQALLTERFTPVDGEAYVMTVIGLADPSSGWVANPSGVSTAAAVRRFKALSETSDPTKSGIYLVHASTDFDACDVYIRGTAKPLATNFKYGDQMTTMVEVSRDRVTFDLTQVGQKTKVLASFSADLGALTNVSVFQLSGFKTPGDNKGGTDTLSMIAVMADGQVARFPLLSGSQTARLQIIHNAAAPALGTIDLYLNGDRRADNFSFRKATPFADVPAGTPLAFGIAPPTSKDAKEITGTINVPALRPGRAYTMIVSGITDTAAFAKNPDGRNITPSITVLEGALEASAVDGKTSLRIAHGATDAPSVIVETDGTPIGGTLGYGDATAEYAAVEPAQDTLWVADPVTKKRIKGYVADLRGNKKAFIALASGFMDPSKNANGPAFRLVLVDASGTVNTSMPEVMPDTTDPGDTTSSVDEPMVPASAWSVAPNPTDDRLTVGVEAPVDHATFVVFDVTGTALMSIKAEGSGRPSVTFPTPELAPGTYVVRGLTPDGRFLGSTRFVKR
ncbi:MAG: DUF4397 domain-containing protein [Candidatus Kapabacteria bacterium]|nr:DUF4397 domain-containing protein [Candidatus Kapabacteria bacterium]